MENEPRVLHTHLITSSTPQHDRHRTAAAATHATSCAEGKPLAAFISPLREKFSSKEAQQFVTRSVRPGMSTSGASSLKKCVDIWSQNLRSFLFGWKWRGKNSGKNSGKRNSSFL